MGEELEVLGVDPAALGIPASMTVAAALGLKWVAGPSLQAVGKAFGDWTDLRVRNLLRLGERVEKRAVASPGESSHVSPRLLHKVLEDGSWIEDDVAQEYLAGILVGSRTHDGADEDGVFMAHMVSNMTAAQLRLHHAFYAKLAIDAPDVEVGDSDVAERHAVWAPLEEVGRVIGRENAEMGAIMAASGLVQASLMRVRCIGEPRIFEPPGMFDRAPTRPTFVAVGTILGATLYALATSGAKYEAPAGSTFQEAWVQDSGTVPVGL